MAEDIRVGALVIGGAVYFALGLTVPSLFTLGSTRLVRLYNVYSMLGSYYVLFSCIYNLAMYLFTATSSDSQSELPFLLAMTRTQTYPLIFVFLDYWMDIGLFIRGVRSDMLDRDTILYHHTLSIIGVAFEVHYKIGGGMMMCLLLDTLEVAFSLMQDLLLEFFPHKMTREVQRRMHMISWVFWIASRLIWYTLVSLWSLVTFFSFYFLNDQSSSSKSSHGRDWTTGVFCFMVLFWTLYASVEHYLNFRDYLSTNSRHLHDTLRLFGIPIGLPPRAQQQQQQPIKISYVHIKKED